MVEKVARVVKAPQSSEVFILTKDPTDVDAKRFIIEDSPESIPIKGMSFSVPPEGLEEEVAAWTVLSKSDSNAIPPGLTLWKWYDARDNIEISDDHKLALFVFSLWRGLPSLFWVNGLKAQVIQAALIYAIKRRPTGCDVTYLLHVSGFLGKSFYKRALAALGTYKDRLNPRQKKFPDNGPRRGFYEFSPTSKQTEKELIKEKQRELEAITSTVVIEGREPCLQIRWDAQKIDCFLYARDDRYE